MERAAEAPPARLAGIPLGAVEDLSAGRHLPPTTGVVWDLADRSRVVIRPSGTEPKLKAYVEVIEPAGGSVAAATERASARMSALREAVTKLLGGADQGNRQASVEPGSR
jgi:phosphomannomutase